MGKEEAKRTTITVEKRERRIDKREKAQDQFKIVKRKTPKVESEGKRCRKEQSRQKETKRRREEKRGGGRIEDRGG